MIGVYRKPYHRDPLLYVAFVLGLLVMLLKASDGGLRLGWRLFDFVMAPVGAFLIVAVVGGFFRDPPRD
ncbi:MAG TPA: hypothetical protein VGB03_05650 [Acidimicrobiales bacterium]